MADVLFRGRPVVTRYHAISSGLSSLILLSRIGLGTPITRPRLVFCLLTNSPFSQPRFKEKTYISPSLDSGTGPPLRGGFGRQLNYGGRFTSIMNVFIKHSYLVMIEVPTVRFAPCM